jgi:hypothetical protein
MYSMHTLLISVQISVGQWITTTTEMLGSFLQSFGAPLGK